MSDDPLIGPSCRNGEISSGDTGFMLVCTAWVMLQTPAMGIAQAGMIRRKNALSMMMQVITGAIIGSLMWFAFGYSLTFGQTRGGYIGDLDQVFFRNTPFTDCNAELADTIPELVFAAFQMMFALMVPVIVTGAWAEKMTMEAFLMFIVFWPILVYYPIAHWVWNPQGFLAMQGVQDFAGGITIHTTSGVSAIVVTFMLQRRKSAKDLVGARARHSTPLFFVGATFIWVGWYSFNAGSAFAATPDAVIALVNTHLSACTGGLVWVLLAKHADGKWHLAEIFSGALAGLACVTPGSGFVRPWSAAVIGVLGGAVSYWTSLLFKERLGWDDVLDVGSLQGTAGFVGSILLGFFSADQGVFSGHPGSGRYLAFQIAASVLALTWAAVWTWIIIYVTKKTTGIDITPEMEEIGLDLVQIGEQAYDEKVSLTMEYSKDELTAKLCEAAGKGDISEVRNLTHAGADPNTGDWDRRTPVHVAAAEGRLSVLQFLVHVHQADFNVRDHENNTPLNDAVRNNRADVVVWLKKKKADFNSETIYQSILEGAASGDAKHLADTLSARLVDINSVADYDKRTGLHVAAAEGHLPCVDLLMKYGADNNVTDRWGHTPLQTAQIESHDECVARMLRKENRVKIGDRSTVGSFIDVATRKISQIIAGSFGSQKEGGDAPISSAYTELKEDSDSVAMLDVAATPRTQDRIDARNFCQAANDGDCDEVKRLRRKGANVNAADHDGRVAMHLAARNGNIEILKYLIGHGGNVNIQDRWHVTPLQEAVRNSQGEAVVLLKKQGAVIADRLIGYKLCQMAATGDLDGMKAQYEAGVDITTVDYDGRTALHLAAAENHRLIVEWLVEHSTYVNVLDRYNHSPLDDANDSFHEENTAPWGDNKTIIDLLKSKGAQPGKTIITKNRMLQRQNTKASFRMGGRKGSLGLIYSEGEASSTASSRSVSMASDIPSASAKGTGIN